MNFIDTHAHLYDPQFDADRDAIMRKSIAAGVHKIYLPNCDSTTIAPMLQLADEWKNNCFPMMGLHPVYVKENFEQELDIVEEWLKKKTFSAIGEIGLDMHWDLTFLEQQQHVFNRQMDWALAYNLPIVIHSRNATQQCIDLVRNKQNGKLRGIFHCFSGTVEEAKAVTELGFYLGIGGVATFKKTNLPEVILAVGIDHIVLETDAPYLAPVPYRGKRNESSYIPLVAEAVSNVLSISVEKVAAITSENAEKVFGG